MCFSIPIVYPTISIVQRFAAPLVFVCVAITISKPIHSTAMMCCLAALDCWFRYLSLPLSFRYSFIENWVYTFVNVSQYILGIQPDYDGLTLNPCIPSNMEEFKIRRYFRGAWYNITFKNPDHKEKGISSLTVNGTAVEGNLIPLTEGCTEYDVVAVM